MDAKTKCYNAEAARNNPAALFSIKGFFLALLVVFGNGMDAPGAMAGERYSPSAPLVDGWVTGMPALRETKFGPLHVSVPMSIPAET